MKIFAVAILAICLFSGLAFATNSLDRLRVSSKLQQEADSSSSEEEIKITQCRLEPIYRFKANKARKQKDSDPPLSPACDPYNRYIYGLQSLANTYNYTDAEIIKHIEGFCSVMPEKARDTCMTLYKLKIEEFLKIYRLYKPDEVAHALGLCNFEPGNDLIHFKLGGTFCTGCEFLMESIQTMFAHGVTEEKIVIAGKAICKKVPLDDRVEVCYSLVSKYAPKLWNFANGKDPETVCKSIGVC